MMWWTRGICVQVTAVLALVTGTAEPVAQLTERTEGTASGAALTTDSLDGARSRPVSPEPGPMAAAAIANTRTTLSVAVPEATPTLAEPLVCPAYDPSQVQHPLPLVPAAETSFGGVSGQFTVGGDGAARYRIPLQAVPGPGGMTPTLSLDYSSRTGNGYVGVGFSLAGPTVISRCPKTIAEDGVTEGVRLDAMDHFCLDGLRLVAVCGTYGGDGTEYRTSPETFARVTSVRTSPGSFDDGPDAFEVRTKDGLIHTYGQGDSDVIGPHRVNWPLTETRDRQGNPCASSMSPSRPPAATRCSCRARWSSSAGWKRFSTATSTRSSGGSFRPTAG